jgi:ADP-ribose pyrophosphatase YjhB (NUDIX family)
MTQIRGILTTTGEEPSSPPVASRLIASYPVLLEDEPVRTLSIEHADASSVAATHDDDTALLDDPCIADLLARATSRLADGTSDDPVNEPGLIAAGGGTRSAGIVLVDDRGWVTIREPANHYGGYRWSYAKGRIDPGETPRQTARRELTEETGLTGRIIGAIGDFKGDTGITRFYVGVRTGGQEKPSAETSAVKTVSPLSALEMLNNSATRTCSSVRSSLRRRRSTGAGQSDGRRFHAGSVMAASSANWPVTPDQVDALHRGAGRRYDDRAMVAGA